MTICCYFTPIISYIINTPEATLIARVGGKTSHLTLASHKSFGDHFRHPTRLGTLTLTQIQHISEEIDPWDLESYVKAAWQHFWLNGVHLPFWRNWTFPDGSIAEPSEFLTPEPLHHWHKQFWDHDAKWCIHTTGSEELNFRFSLLQLYVGFQHFNAGISSLKQVTSQDHQNVQCYIISIIADTVPKEFILCIRALSNFRYLGQSHSVDNHTLSEISTALDLFHKNKHTILNARARVGKGSKPINNFFIPKLELLHSVVNSIHWSGIPIQWSADSTEHAHINVIKTPSDNTNTSQYGPQICHHLDHDERRCFFNLATVIHEAGDGLESILYDSGGGQGEGDDELYEELKADWIAELNTIATICGPSRKAVDLFTTADALATHSTSKGMASVPWPLCTFSTTSAAFKLNQKPDIPQITIDSLAEKYSIPDLHLALLNFFSQCLQTGSVHHISGHQRTQATTQLPFKHVMVWSSLCMQTQLMDDGLVTDPQRLIATPPSDIWPLGWYDTALFVNDSASPTHWGQRGYYPGGKLRVYWEFLTNIPSICPLGKLRIFWRFIFHFALNKPSG